MATLLGTLFSTTENQVSQCDDQTLGLTLAISFDQENFEQLLTGVSKNPLRVCKHRKVNVASVPMATSGKQVSDETTEILHEPNSVLCEAN